MNFLQQLEQNSNKTTTENGAVTHRSTLSPLVDFFALAGATRNNPELGLDLFRKALAENTEYAIKLLFYFRDIRGGQGERLLFRNGLRELAQNYPEQFAIIAPKVAEYGRWDDLLVAMDFQEAIVIDIIRKQWAKDYKSENPSLLGKWLPSENTSNKESVHMARRIIKALDITPKEYRQNLVALRKQIKIIENNLRQKEYKAINYSNVPSKAGMKYVKAFFRNDEERYKAFLDSIKKKDPKVKINTDTLYPHELYNKVKREGNNDAYNLMWNNLPDYTKGKNGIVVADVSGSMDGVPMSVSVSLALYFAERNKGQFKDRFITFSKIPTLQKVVGDNLYGRMRSIETASWDMNTNIQAVFDLVLSSAKQSNAFVDELPSVIYIISDMEFDTASDNKQTNYEAIKEKYENAGYPMPQLVFWNVNARNKQVPATYDENGVALISGMSPTTFSLAVGGKTPYETMLEVIHSPRYATLL